MEVISQNSVQDTTGEAKAISDQAFNNIRHIARTLQSYVLETELELEPENEAVISALLDRIVIECE